MVKPSTASVVIFAAAALYREAWSQLLCRRSDMQVCGAIAKLSELSPLVRRGNVTAVLIDLPTPDPNIARELRAMSTAVGLLFLVTSYDLAEVVTLLEAGATGCISRDASLDDLEDAILAVGRGEIVLPASIAAHGLASLARGAKEIDSLHLSEREMEVLFLLGQGFTNRTIAQELSLSPRTIESHMRSIFTKLRVHSRTEAALWATRHAVVLQRVTSKLVRKD